MASSAEREQEEQRRLVVIEGATQGSPSSRRRFPSRLAAAAAALAALGACALLWAQKQPAAKSSMMSESVVGLGEGNATGSVIDTPRLMSHDAATGYMGNFQVVPTLCRLYQTQTLPFGGQLACGARALDLRLGWKDGHWRYYHGNPGKASVLNYYLGQSLEETMAEIVDWANEDGHEDELVMLFFSHCLNGSDSIACSDVPAGASDSDTIPSKLQAIGIPMLPLDRCPHGSESALPAQEAMTMSKLGSGTGHVLAIFDCNNDNYGQFYKVGFDDWTDLEGGIDKVLGDTGGTFQGGFWQLQCVWQLEPTLKQIKLDYGTVMSNSKSNLNSKISDKYANRSKSSGGLWLVDNICSGGIDFAKAIGTSVTEADEARCTSDCNGATNKCGSDFECAQWYDTNGCCKCVEDPASPYDCSKKSFNIFNNDRPSCDQAPCAQDCASCPQYGWKC